MNPEDDFFVMLQSNARKELYPQNTQSAFTIPMDHGYHLDGSWEVALHRIIMSKPPDTDIVFVYTDVVVDTFISRGSYPLLELIPTSNEMFKGVYQPMHLQYRRVRQNLLLKDISIKLCNKNGEMIVFGDNPSDVFIELHFRRKSI